ncbi:MAG: hypothetical protein WBW93_17830 [Steroidobacteraceae bacterium]
MKSISEHLVELIDTRIRVALARSPREPIVGAPPSVIDQALEAQIMEAVEQAIAARLTSDTAPGQPAPLRARNAVRVAEGARLREAIRPLLEADRGPSRGAAKRVLRALGETDIGRAEQPSLRAVQHHITQLRKAAALRSKRL